MCVRSFRDGCRVAVERERRARTISVGGLLLFLFLFAYFCGVRPLHLGTHLFFFFFFAAAARRCRVAAPCANFRGGHTCVGTKWFAVQWHQKTRWPLVCVARHLKKKFRSFFSFCNEEEEVVVVVVGEDSSIFLSAGTCVCCTTWHRVLFAFIRERAHSTAPLGRGGGGRMGCTSAESAAIFAAVVATV